jgi:ABC-2 type transport system permease protein
VDKSATLRELLAEFTVYRRLLAARARSEMQYRVSFIMQLVGNLILHIMEFVTILIFFRHFDAIGGWRAGDIAFLYGLGGIAFGLAHSAAAGFSSFDQLIRQGTFDRILTRPVGMLVQVLGGDLQLRRLGQVAQGVAALIVAITLIDIPWTVGRILYLPVVLLSTIVLFMSLFALEAVMCFWTTEANETVNAFTYGGSLLTQYPLHIYEQWLRRLFFFIIPLGFVIYAPSLYLLDKPNPLGLPAVTKFVAPVAAAGFAAVALAAWRVGVRHYRSTGT